MPVTVAVRHEGSLPDDASGEGLVAIGVRQGSLDEDAPGASADLARLGGFEGKVGQTLRAATDDGIRLLVGVGETIDPSRMRAVGAAVAKAAAAADTVFVDVVGALEGTERAAALDDLTQGLLLGSYRYEQYKDTPKDVRLASAVVVAKGGKRSGDAVERGRATAEAVALARDLVNTPGGDLTPKAFAARAVKAGEAAGLEVDVMDKGAIRKAKLGGLLGVARGSFQEPRFVTLTYRPEGKARGSIALVGKGVTFDAGGLSIKTGAGMIGMKGDMGGAAAVLGAMTLVSRYAPKVQVTAYLPLTDNMLGPDATRVGDVLRARNGKTVEVLNTDAEGRLILADALALAAEAEPDAIIDLATLTGACMVALGDRTAGLMSNDDRLRARVEESAASVGEGVWPLPLPEYLRKTLDSTIADLRNIGTGSYGGALTAGLFLQEFVGDVPWAHLDIAGPSDAATPYDEVGKGGSGFGVRTIVELLANWSKLPAA